jgi:hypothetical protein
MIGSEFALLPDEYSSSSIPPTLANCSIDSNGEDNKRLIHDGEGHDIVNFSTSHYQAAACNT